MSIYPPFEPHIPAPTTPFLAYLQATGIQPKYFFVGASLQAETGDVLLSNTDATVDQLVPDVMPAYLTDSFLLSHAYGTPLVTSRLEAPALDSLALGDGNISVHIRYQTAVNPFSVGDLVGNREVGSPAGLEIQSDQNGQVSCSVGAAATVKTVGAISSNTWTDVVAIIHRAPGQPGTLTLGTVDEDVTAVGAVAAGLINDARPWSIGQGRGNAAIGLIMSVVFAVGPQLDGRVPSDLAQSAARLVYWDELRGISKKAAR